MTGTLTIEAQEILDSYEKGEWESVLTDETSKMYKLYPCCPLHGFNFEFSRGVTHESWVRGWGRHTHSRYRSTNWMPAFRKI